MCFRDIKKFKVPFCVVNPEKWKRLSTSDMSNTFNIQHNITREANKIWIPRTHLPQYVIV